MTNPLPNQKAEPLVFRTDLDFAGIRFKMRKQTLGATIHCSASRPSQNWGSVDIDRMHRQRSFLCIGYHFVITRDGTIHTGRPLDAEGAHCKHDGRNKTHVGICLVGGVSQKPQSHIPGSPWNGSDAEANFTDAQGVSLRRLLDFVEGTYGFTDDEVEGHRDVKGVRKACPSFNVDTFLSIGHFELD